MGRKKLISKMALLAVIIFVVSVLVLLLQIPYRNAWNEKYEERLKTHISDLTQQYQNYLKETAAKINSIPADPKTISEIQSRILRENTQIKLYLWMVNNAGEFVFGSPAAIFAKMNTAYDKYKDNIESDGHFINRNEFLANLVAHYNEIDFSEFESKTIIKNENYIWRFYNEENEFYDPQHFNYSLRLRPVEIMERFPGRYSHPYLFLLSNPVIDSSGVVIGELYLKIDDSKNYKLYNKDIREIKVGVIQPIFIVLTLFSGLFLWFLLPTWVYTDAQQRDAKNPGLWAFLTLISLFFGLTIYLITRPSTHKSLSCPKCENELNGMRAFCPHCGFDLSSTFCPQCQYPIKQSWQFCPNCRAQLAKNKEAEEKAIDKSED